MLFLHIVLQMAADGRHFVLIPIVFFSLVGLTESIVVVSIYPSHLYLTEDRVSHTTNTEIVTVECSTDPPSAVTFANSQIRRLRPAHEIELLASLQYSGGQLRQQQVHDRRDTAIKVIDRNTARYSLLLYNPGCLDTGTYICSTTYTPVNQTARQTEKGSAVLTGRLERTGVITTSLLPNLAKYPQIKKYPRYGLRNTILCELPMASNFTDEKQYKLSTGWNWRDRDSTVRKDYFVNWTPWGSEIIVEGGEFYKGGCGWVAATNISFNLRQDHEIIHNCWFELRDPDSSGVVASYSKEVLLSPEDVIDSLNNSGSTIVGPNVTVHGRLVLYCYSWSVGTNVTVEWRGVTCEEGNSSQYCTFFPMPVPDLLVVTCMLTSRINVRDFGRTFRVYSLNWDKKTQVVYFRANGKMRSSLIQVDDHAENVTLECQAIGDPVPEIRVYKVNVGDRGGEILMTPTNSDEQAVKFEVLNTYHVGAPMKSCSETYRCDASNSNGNDSAHVTVTRAPCSETKETLSKSPADSRYYGGIVGFAVLCVLLSALTIGLIWRRRKRVRQQEEQAIAQQQKLEDTAQQQAIESTAQRKVEGTAQQQKAEGIAQQQKAEGTA